MNEHQLVVVYILYSRNRNSTFKQNNK